jgi:hypothetical protein
MNYLNIFIQLSPKELVGKINKFSSIFGTLDKQNEIIRDFFTNYDLKIQYIENQAKCTDRYYQSIDLIFKLTLIDKTNVSIHERYLCLPGQLIFKHELHEVFPKETKTIITQYSDKP